LYGEVRYYAFGGTRYTWGSTPTTYRYTGQRQEAALGGADGLYFYGARWYDSYLGRFLSADTMVPSPGNPQSLNRYSYVLNNALKYVDPTGHKEACGAYGESCNEPPPPTTHTPPQQDLLKQMLKQVDDWAWDHVPSTIGLHWKVISGGEDILLGANGYPADFAVVANWRSGEIGLLHTGGAEARFGTPNLITLQTEVGVVAYNGASRIRYVGGPSIYVGGQVSADTWGYAGVSATGFAIGMDSNLETATVGQVYRGEYYSNFFVDPESGRFVTGGSLNGVMGVNAIANGVDVSGDAGAGFTHVMAAAKFSDAARYAFPTSQ
jgi:RHS repeat-associated protein